MVRRTDHPAMTIAVDLGRKATNQTNKQTKIRFAYICIPEKMLSCYWSLNFLCLIKNTGKSGDIILNL